MTDRTISTLRRRLEKWELQHLRQHASDLAERLERAEEDAARANESADFWHQQCMNMIAELQDEGAVIGLTKGGEIVIGEKAGGAA